MFSPEALITQIHDLPHGEPRLDALSNAIAEADSASAHEWRFYFRREYINESIFHGDSFKAIICFPELLQIVDEHPEVEEDNEYELMWAFKNVLENTFDFYQISREEIENYFEEFRKRSLKYGLTMRVYHMKKCKFYLAADPALVKESYEAFHKERRDSNSDCEACEMNFDMKVALALGEEEEALRIAQPLLDGKKRCAEVPHVTYGELAWHYLYKGDLEEAAYYGSRCERMIGNEPEFLEQAGILLELNSAVNPAHGWKLFKHSLENFMACRNPLMRMCYARGAYRLVNVLVSLTEPDDRFTKSAMVRVLPLEMTEKGMSMEAITAYFYQIAKEQSERLDARNGNTCYMDILQTELKAAEETGETEKRKHALHGLVPKHQSLLAVTLPEGETPSMETLAERIRNAVPEGAELLTADPDDDNLHIVLRQDGKIFEGTMVQADAQGDISARPVAGMDQETFARMLDNPHKYIFNTELSDSPLTDYAMTMQVLYILLPEMLGVIDLGTQHAYPPEWVRYVGAYPDAVDAHDMFGIYITGSEERNEVWMCTLGLSALGMRELEIIGAEPENFSVYADMLDDTAAQVVERNLLPDAGQPTARCFYDETDYTFTWGLPEDHAAEGTIASEVNREWHPAVLLVETEDGVKLPPLHFGNAEEIQYPNLNSAFHRRIRLAKATFEVFRDAVQKPIERAAARLEFELDDAAVEEFGYGIELLWAEVRRVENGRIFAEIMETSEALPEVHEGDEIEITQERVAAWFVHPEGFDHPVREGDGYALWREERP